MGKHPAPPERRDPICYRHRNQVERFFSRIKHCRRIATRYERRAANLLAFIKLAAFRLWLRVNESTTSHIGEVDIASEPISEQD